MKTRWVVANIMGAVTGIGAGIVVAQGLLTWASRSPYYEDVSGFPIGWSFYIALLIATLSGAIGVTIGYALRQKLARQRFTTRNAVGYAAAGALLWPIVGILFVMAFVFVVTPIIELFVSNASGAVFDVAFLIGVALAIVVLALPVGLVVAVLRREEVEW